ncbi:hypothetical protein HYU19_04610 [Candidatus Woesearchaeota archaeon]|nr:hypothetical protein [Candidatus Woesearchaeota archaeon]
MNRIDKQWLKALKYFADNTRARVIADKESNDFYYKEVLPEDLKNTFVGVNYLDFNSNTKHIITQSGLQQLRELERNNRESWGFRFSIIAIIISCLSFAISMGWINFR